MWSIINALKIVKNSLTLISRVMKLEERVSILEKKIEVLQAPPLDIKNGLAYNKDWNYYEDKNTGECFCSTCIGNGKKIPIKVKKGEGSEGWYCPNCKTTQYKYFPSEYRSLD